MWTAIAGIIQILILILQNKFQSDAEERKRKDAALTGWKEVATSGDISRINSFIDGVRK